MKNENNKLISISNVKKSVVFGDAVIADKETVLKLGLYVNGTLQAEHFINGNSAQDETDSATFEIELNELQEWLSNTIEIRSISDEGDILSSDSTLYCPKIEEFSIELHNVFDAGYYVSRYMPGEMHTDFAFDHYLSSGIYEDANPNLWFSNSFFRERYSELVGRKAIPVLIYLDREPQRTHCASEIFSPNHYAAANPDLTGVHPLLAHYVQHGHKEGRNCTPVLLQNELVTEVESLIEIEPLLEPISSNQTRIVKYPFLKKSVFAPSIVRRHLGQEIKAIVCTPFISVGGADLVSTYVLKALQNRYGEKSVIFAVTDQSRIERPDWLSSGSELLDLPELCGEDTDANTRLETLYHIIGELNPDLIFNVNSNITWELYKKYGKQLSSAIDLYAYLFCFDYNQHEKRVGYIPAYLPACIGNLKKVFFDNKQIVDDVSTLYGFSSNDRSRLQTLYIPSEELDSIATIHQARPAFPARKRKVLWAGRFAKQKRVDVLIEIANSMPDVQFDVYGSEGNAPEGRSIIENRFANICFKGTFSAYEELSVHEYDAYLYTSQWDGIPSILINMMRMGVPVCAPEVGGIPELVFKDTGWPIKNYDDIQAFETTLRRIFSSRDIVKQKSRRGIKHVKDRHHWELFNNTIAEAIVDGNQTTESPTIATVNT